MRLCDAIASLLGTRRINVTRWAAGCGVSRTTLYSEHPSWTVVERVAAELSVTAKRLAKEIAK